MLACLPLGGRWVEPPFQFLARIRLLGCERKLPQLYHNRVPLLETISLFSFHKYWLAGFTWQWLGIVTADTKAPRAQGLITSSELWCLT